MSTTERKPPGYYAAKGCATRSHAAIGQYALDLLLSDPDLDAPTKLVGVAYGVMVAEYGGAREVRDPRDEFDLARLGLPREVLRAALDRLDAAGYLAGFSGDIDALWAQNREGRRR
jgi:hypothetical protein